MRENVDQNNFEYRHFLRSDFISSKRVPDKAVIGTFFTLCFSATQVFKAIVNVLIS